MWSSLTSNLIQQTGQSLGYTAGVGIAIDAMLLANEYVLVPAFKAADIKTSKLIWGEEAALKTEQDWVEVQDQYLNPVFDFVKWTNTSLKGSESKQQEDQASVSQPLSLPNLQYSKEGKV